MDKTTAEQLWTRLSDGLNDVEATLIEIIESKAWEPLGYASFTDAWNDRLKDSRLANRTDMLRAHVVYALFAEGLTDEEVIVLAKVPDARVKNLRAAVAANVPAERAAGYKAEPTAKVTRSTPETRSGLRLEFSAQELVYWNATIEDDELLHELAADAVRSRLNGYCSTLRKIAR